MLFNEPKLLKLYAAVAGGVTILCFSALQRAEIAEILARGGDAESARCFSALQRAEIAEIGVADRARRGAEGFSALQRAEIAEIPFGNRGRGVFGRFQCSSTSRNC